MKQNFLIWYNQNRWQWFSAGVILLLTPDSGGRASDYWLPSPCRVLSCAVRAPTLGPPLLDHVTSGSVPRLAKLRFPQLQDGTTVSCISLAVVRIRWYHLCQVLRTVSNTQSVLATTIMIPANSGSLQVRTGHLEDPCLPPRLQGPCLASQPSPGVSLCGEWGQPIGRHSPEQSFKQQCPETQTLEDFSDPKTY